ncbi:MAG TPA: substrate-binding domain-containing protein [Saprospiraceae bacterium]|nr:substrate-binding domain-containing protein [Saprospiraceae bacterium]
MRKYKKYKNGVPFKFYYLGIYIILFSISCAPSNSTEKENTLSTPYSGKTKIAVDETFKPIIDSQLTVFEKTYQAAHITANYVPEGEAIKSLLDDSTQLIIITRKLSDQEDKFFRSKDYIPHTSESAKDGVAVILNHNNNDTIMSFIQLNQLLKGEISKWKEINKDSKSGNIELVFDNSLSSTYRFLQEKFDLKGLIAKNTYSAGNNEKVIEYVSKTPGAMGFIGVNWISDSDDSTVVGFKKRINVVAIYPKPEMKGAGEAYQPYQAYLALGYYPLTRYVYSICTEPRNGLASGFSSFINGPVGQKIFEKSGLMPARLPARIIRITK